MRACAPGKLVLSGAYSVLEGAPAIVTAVDRYVCADSSRPARIVTPEVRAALPEAEVPDFDASALRDDGRKLGLGSSAAILVASLAAADTRHFDADHELRQAIFMSALAAHRQAQGGGSGIDVAASTWGGTQIARLSSTGGLELEPARLPPELVVEAWASQVSASTHELLGSVARWRERSPDEYVALMGVLRSAAERAAAALRSGQTPDLITELTQQRLGFSALGRAAGVAIVTPEVERLALATGPRAAAVLPSGAGGGDIVLWLADRASPPGFRDLAASLGHHQLSLSLHARGVQRCLPESTLHRGS
jgi:phosphomevalonate kinase